MRSDIRETFDNLEIKYGKLLQQLNSLTDDELYFKAGEDKWSMVYRHPFAGPLDMVETLLFIDVHFDNHMRHIDRLLAAGG